MNNSGSKGFSEKTRDEGLSSSLPEVSVVIPVYNVAPFVAETLASVFSQTFSDFEVVVVNDGSPDTKELEKEIAPYLKRITYLSQKNQGTAAARNTAIRQARGEFIAFLDGDDIWMPDYLETQMKFLAAENYEMVYSDAVLFGNANFTSKTFMEKSPSNGEADFISLVSGKCNVITSGTVVAKKRILEAGLFDEELPKIGMEDFDLWLRLAKRGTKIGYQRNLLLKYRVRTNSLSGNNLERARRNIVGLEIVKKKLDLTKEESEAIEAALKHAEAEFKLEEGKAFLMQKKFEESRVKFAEANSYYQNSKLAAAVFLLNYSPRLLRFLFKMFRAGEVPFIPTSESN